MGVNMASMGLALPPEQRMNRILGPLQMGSQAGLNYDVNYDLAAASAPASIPAQVPVAVPQQQQQQQQQQQWQRQLQNQQQQLLRKQQQLQQQLMMEGQQQNPQQQQQQQQRFQQQLNGFGSIDHSMSAANALSALPQPLKPLKRGVSKTVTDPSHTGAAALRGAGDTKARRIVDITDTDDAADIDVNSED